MNAISALDPIVPGRHFSNAVITWKVNNISLAMCSQKIIYSPLITLSGPIETCWRLSLDISKEKERLVLYLEMLPKGFRKKGVRVNWASYILDIKSEGSFVQERSYSFQTNCKLAVQMFWFSSLFEKLRKTASDDLNIKCHMLVQFGFNPVFQKTRAEGVVSLSNDLSTLPRSFLYHDVISRAGNVVFSLHRAMLCHRGEKLAQLIQQLSSNKVNLPLSNAMAAEALFTYLYTGDLTYILSRPSLTISDYIERLGISELQNVYPKDIITIESKIDGKEYTFRWIIANFRKVNDIISYELRADGLESRWNLHLCPRGLTDDSEQRMESLYIEVVLVESQKPLDVCFECSSVKGVGQTVHSRKIQGRMTVGTKLGFSFFEGDSDEIENCLNENSLSLRFKVLIATGADFSIITENSPSMLMPFNNERSFMILSKTMGLLLRSQDYYDFLFQIEDQEFKAHKFLIAARSPTLKEQLQKEKTAAYFRLTGCRKDIFSVFLSYMYIGIIVETNPSKLMELHDLGRMYRVYSLVEVCENILHKLLSKENVLQILVWADGRGDKLKDAAFDLVLDLADHIREHPYWNYFRSVKPDLYYKFEELSS